MDTNRRQLVMDTDAYNQVDDLFALAYLAMLPDVFEIEALTAAPFYRDLPKGNPRSKDPEDGMEKSYDELKRFVNVLGREDLLPKIHRGATNYYHHTKAPTQASEEICRLATAGPITVLATGCLTNVAQALDTKPEIAKNLEVVWLGGHADHYGPADDFNYIQDPEAVRLVFESGSKIVQFPCFGVTSEFRLVPAELREIFQGADPLFGELVDRFIDWGKLTTDTKYWSKPIWDLVPAIWLHRPETCLAREVLPRVPDEDHRFKEVSRDLPQQTYIYYVNKDQLLQAMLEVFYPSSLKQ